MTDEDDVNLTYVLLGLVTVALILFGVLAVAGCTTYTHAAKVETVLGFVTDVQGGEVSQQSPSALGGLDRILSALWSFTGLLCVLFLLAVVALWKFPRLRDLLTAKALRHRLRAKAP